MGTPTKMPTLVPTLPISPTEAAKRISVSRRTVMRAIEQGHLLARRDNRNRWKIDPHDVDKWAGGQGVPTGHAHLKVPSLPTPDAATSEVELERLRGEVRTERALREAAEARCVEIGADRDHWRGMAEALARRRRWWPWGGSHRG